MTFHRPEESAIDGARCREHDSPRAGPIGGSLATPAGTAPMVAALYTAPRD